MNTQMKYKFPQGFEWGTATASYQIEGGVHEGGRGESIWDRFSHTPGRIVDGSNGDVACDFYHRYEEDIQLAKNIGLKVYRLSIAWPRILPGGMGECNQDGIAFYRRVLSCIRENGLTSTVTIYHWDLPQKLQDKGGWANRDIVGWFTEYSKILFSELGDLVDRWITVNEPYCACILGYWVGFHAPGYHDYSMALTAVHNMLLSHGAAVKAYRESGLTAEIGIAMNMNLCYPYDPDSKEDQVAAERVQMHTNNMLGDPVVLGRYPEELFSYLARMGVVLPEIQPGDMELISQKIDFFGLNTYYPEFIQANNDSWPLGGAIRKTGRMATDAGWEVEASTMTELLMWIHKRYNPQKLIITENGAACNDWLNVDGEVIDSNRIDYFRRYLMAVHDAIAAGVPVAGYYAWCFCDNFEWEQGLSRRFGIVYVDYATQKRIGKESSKWLGTAAKNNGF